MTARDLAMIVDGPDRPAVRAAAAETLAHCSADQIAALRHPILTDARACRAVAAGIASETHRTPRVPIPCAIGWDPAPDCGRRVAPHPGAE